MPPRPANQQSAQNSGYMLRYLASDAHTLLCFSARICLHLTCVAGLSLLLCPASSSPLLPGTQMQLPVICKHAQLMPQ